MSSPTITAELSAHAVPEHMIEAAAAIVEAGEVERLGEHTYKVRGYTVTIADARWSCDCPSRIRCKHMIAALGVHTGEVA